jgi:ABC-type branched-subunit amino acid transport system substrate-binding protein
MAPLTVAAVLALAGAAACGGSDGGGSGGGSGGNQVTTAVDVTKPGPDKGWSSGGLTVSASSLACNGPAPNPTRGVTDTTVKIGGLAFLTSPSGASHAGAAQGAKARFERANAEGGVAGRKIQFIGVLDDAQDPARDGEQAEALVNQQKVFAVAPLMTIFPNYLDTFCRQKVPFFGWGVNTGYCGNVLGFGITGCLVPTKETANVPYLNLANGVLARRILGTDPKGKTIALIGEDSDAARNGINTFDRVFTAAGMKVVYKEAAVPRSGLNDATPIVSAVMRSNGGHPPDMIYHTLTLPSVLKLSVAFKAVGFKGAQINAVGYDPKLAASKDLDGAYVALQWTPGVATGVPGVKQMIEDIKKYAPGQELSLSAMAGYWSADFLVNALAKTGRKLTVDTFLNTLNNGSFTNHVPGALPESRWPLNHLIGTPCESSVQLKNGAYTPLGPLACGVLARVK